MPAINVLSEKELEEYQSWIFAYKTVLNNLDNLEKQKQEEPELNWFFSFVGVLSLLPIAFALPIYLINIILSLFGNTTELLDGWGIIIGIGMWIGWLFFMGWIGELSEKLGINDYLINVLTLGKLKRARENNNQINQKIDKIKEEKENLKEKVRNFELEIKNYYDKYLENFFLENLYKKRSASAGYGENLETFSLMVDEVKEINKLLVIEKCSLYKYEEYLLSKQIKIALQGQNNETSENKKINYITPLGKKLHKIIKQDIKPKEIIPPEILYHTARQIDWESVNKQRGLTGSQGEQIAMALERDYLIQGGNQELADKVKNVAKEIGDGLGYDILSYFPNGKEKYIEVKSTSKAMGQSFYMSSNELTFLQEHPEQAFIHRIFSVNDDSADYRLQILSAEEILTSQIIPKEYLIKL